MATEHRCDRCEETIQRASLENVKVTGSCPPSYDLCERCIRLLRAWVTGGKSK